jgi:hypothetical protein
MKLLRIVTRKSNNENITVCLVFSDGNVIIAEVPSFETHIRKGLFTADAIVNAIGTLNSELRKLLENE